MAAIKGPIALYNNPPIETQYYAPGMFFISAIVLGITTKVTTSVNHNYVIGQQVRLLIPFSFGSRGLNNTKSTVISIPSANQVVLSISSIGVNPFIASNAKTKAQIVAIGDINSGIISSTGRVIPSTNIPGSFINIS